MTMVKILRNFPISPDGIRVEVWQENTQREVNDETLALLIAQGACEIVETKAHIEAPENKRGRSRKVTS
jgi:hypothetical protein